ncbi:MAG TPA: urease accessory protein UreD [Burkholderiaceae bacterium]|nr:urease accessory protein UreD [Burkholderiaceae bacterium]
MGWAAELSIHYSVDAEGRTVAHDRHDGPLRVLQRLYPEGPGVCHHVLVHPPGGIVGGDEISLHLRLDAGTHALLTTPGATRFYRSASEQAEQRVVAQVGEGARLEWLPMETIAYRGCIASNHLRFELAPDAQMIGWDMLALGLPATGEPFDAGSCKQHIELPGVWLERGRIAGKDRHLLDSPLGFAGRRVLATLWLAAGRPLAPPKREALLAAARHLCNDHVLAATAGSTSPHDRLVLLRVLAERVEPAHALLTQVWVAWRRLQWGMQACAPRVWRT